MTAYLPRFTLRRALIAIALLALFLGWLRPDRAEWHWNEQRRGVTFLPIWPNCHISVARFEESTPKLERIHYYFGIVINK